jgi:Fe-S-cluster containining protein
MNLPLSRAYSSPVGAPTVDRIDPRLFTETFFSKCMDCTFCHDSCCQYGATVEVPMMEALLARRAELEPVVKRPAEEWFDGEFRDDPEYPGGAFTRTRVYDGRCVFLNRQGRGCLLHSYALTHNIPVHSMKPMACNLFPVWWYEGAIVLPPEIEERELICLGEGETLYRSARGDLLGYYGPELVEELDRLERQVMPQSGPRTSLPLC